MPTWKWNYDLALGEGGQRFVSGTGSPDGVLTAPPGSLYVRVDGIADHTLYVKETGIGNTGWVAIGSGGGTVLTLKTNNVDNGSQTTLNLAAGSGVSLVDDGFGTVTISSSSTLLQTNGVSNATQNKLNLVNGSNIVITDDGSGDVTVTASIPVTPAGVPTPNVAKVVRWTPTGGSGTGPNAWSILGDNYVDGNNWSSNNGFPPVWGYIEGTSTTNPFWRAFSNYSSGPHSTTSAAFQIGKPVLSSYSDIDFRAVVGTQHNNGNSDANNNRLWVGIYDPNTLTEIGFIDSSSPAGNHVGFLFDPSSSPNWKCSAGTGTNTQVTTSVPVTLGQHYKLNFKLNASLGTVQYYIDGTLVATINTNVPQTGTLAMIFSTIPMNNLSNNGGIEVEYLYCENTTL